MLRQLRPVFYSVDNQPEVLSGWINPKTQDVFTTKADNLNDIEVVPRARPAFQTGERVEFTGCVALYPCPDITPNERGNVASWDLDTGAVSIFLEGIHDGLEDNTLIIVPFHDDSVVQSLRRFRNGVEPLPVEEDHSNRSMVWVVAALALATPAALLIDNTVGYVMAPSAFGLAVLVMALVFGRLPAVVLALIAPVVSNFFLGAGLGFEWPAGHEVFRACLWLFVAVVAPWLEAHSTEVKARADAIAQLLRSHKTT